MSTLITRDFFQYNTKFSVWSTLSDGVSTFSSVETEDSIVTLISIYSYQLFGTNKNKKLVSFKCQQSVVGVEVVSSLFHVEDGSDVM